MQVLLQRVSSAVVRVDGTVVGEVGLGLVALVGVGQRSLPEDADWLAAKTAGLRVFADADGLLNRSVLDVGGGVLAISQFTLYGDATKGRRPSFVTAAAPAVGNVLYQRYCSELEEQGIAVGRGVFGAHMVISMVADGPVTIRLQRETAAPR